MMEVDAINQFAQFMAAGGDIGVWVVAWLLWKFDNRITALEWRTRDCPANCPKSVPKAVQ